MALTLEELNRRSARRTWAAVWSIILTQCLTVALLSGLLYRVHREASENGDMLRVVVERQNVLRAESVERRLRTEAILARLRTLEVLMEQKSKR